MPFMHKISTWVVRVNGKHPKLVQQQRQQQQQQQESVMYDQTTPC